MSKRGFDNMRAVQQSIDDNSNNHLREELLEEVENITNNGGKRWQHEVLETVGQLYDGCKFDVVAYPENNGPIYNGYAEGINKRLGAALGSWRSDADGGSMLRGDDGSVLWHAGSGIDGLLSTEFVNRRIFRAIFNTNILQDGKGGEMITVDPNSVAVFVASRRLIDDNRSQGECTLFTGGEELARLVAERISSGLVANIAHELASGEKENSVMKKIGGAVLEISKYGDLDRWNENRVITNLGTGAEALVFVDQFGSRSVYPGEERWSNAPDENIKSWDAINKDIAIKAYKEVIDLHGGKSAGLFTTKSPDWVE